MVHTNLDGFSLANHARTIRQIRQTFLLYSTLICFCSLSHGGKVIIMSIHQPRYSIYKLFDSITLMSQGRIAYHGPAASVLHYFSELGNDVHTHTNTHTHTHTHTYTYTTKFSTCTVFIALKKTMLLNALLSTNIQASNSKSIWLIML